MSPRPIAPDPPVPRSTVGIGEESALAAIVRSSHDAVIAKSLDGVVTSWNQGAQLLYGYQADEIIGRNIEITVPPEAVADERARHARVAAGVAESGYRCVRVNADGQRVEVVMSMSPILDLEGQVGGIASISRLVSNKERADARFAALLDAAPDAMVCVDRSGRIATVNAQVRAMFGYAAEELVGQPVELLLPADLRARHAAHQATFQLAPQARSMGVGLELSARRRDGTTFPVEVSLASSIAGGDEVVIAAVRDVTEQRAVASALRENDARFRQLAESVEIVFVLRQLDPPAFLYVSPGCQNIFGLAPEALIADPSLATELLHPADRARVQAHYFAEVRVGHPAVSEHRIIRPDGSVRWIRGTSTPVAHTDGQAERTVITVEDITERRLSALALEEAEAAARAANNAKSEFLSRMSHELRTPLNAVLGFGQLLDRQLGGTEHSEAIGHILKGGRHLLELINDVLDIARIEAGEMSMSVEPVPLGKLISESVQLMRPLADAAQVTLITNIAPYEMLVQADRQRLRQILLNLLSNAVKYNHRHGNVWVEAALTGPHELTLAVRDDGLGIATELQDRVFTPFDRLGAEGGIVEGTGIGLSLTRSLTELMGGTISLTSVPGEGCRFAVTLPGVSGEQAVPAQEPASRGSQQAALVKQPKATLLYIEDNEPNVRVVEHLLRLRPGWSLIHAGLGTLGLELAQAHLPDLILLDLHLPDRSGQSVLAGLKQAPRTAGIPVVVLSADANAGQAQRLTAAGAHDYLTKPLDIDAVLSLLDQTSEGLAAGHV